MYIKYILNSSYFLVNLCSRYLDLEVFDFIFPRFKEHCKVFPYLNLMQFLSLFN